jgi:hypothetical protein
MFFRIAKSNQEALRKYGKNLSLILLKNKP